MWDNVGENRYGNLGTHSGDGDGDNPLLLQPSCVRRDEWRRDSRVPAPYPQTTMTFIDHTASSLRSVTAVPRESHIALSCCAYSVRIRLLSSMDHIRHSVSDEAGRAYSHEYVSAGRAGSALASLARSHSAARVRRSPSDCAMSAPHELSTSSERGYQWVRVRHRILPSVRLQRLFAVRSCSPEDAIAFAQVPGAMQDAGCQEEGGYTAH